MPDKAPALNELITGERYETERKKYGTVRFNPGLFN